MLSYLITALTLTCQAYINKMNEHNKTLETHREEVAGTAPAAWPGWPTPPETWSSDRPNTLRSCSGRSGPSQSEYFQSPAGPPPSGGQCIGQRGAP